MWMMMLRMVLYLGILRWLLLVVLVLLVLVLVLVGMLLLLLGVLLNRPRMLRLSRCLLLVIKAAHTGKGQRVRRRTGRALSVLIDGLASGRRIAILRGRRRRSMACWRAVGVRVVVSPRSRVVHWLERRRGGMLRLLLLRLARRASWGRRMGHGRRRRGRGWRHALWEYLEGRGTRRVAALRRCRGMRGCRQCS